MKIICAALSVIILLSATVFILSRHENEPVSDTRFMLDTVCTVTLYDWEGNGSGIIDGSFDICRKYEKMLSATISGSDIFRINHSGGKPVQIAGECADLIRRSIEYCRLSGGKFDITVYPAKNLWDFSGESSSVPDSETLAMAASMIDYTKISVEGNTVTLPEGMGIDLGAVAKGFIADRIADYLRKNGVSSAIIDLGGNIYVLGCKPDGSDWRVGIRKPFDAGEADVVEAADSSVVTSGVYQRYFEKDGIIYHHILRSSDGMPCDTGLYSVTVISKCSEQCDALSTMCMLLGYKESVRLLSQFPETKAVFITSDYQLIYY